MNEENRGEIIMYQTEDGLTEIQTTLVDDTVWLTANQMAELFCKDETTLRKHIERNQKPLAPEITLALTHYDRQKQVEVKRSSRVNPHEIRLFSGCPYAVVK